MNFKLYKIVENITKNDFTHCKLDLVDLTTKAIIEKFVKLKIGTSLEDDSNNVFRVNGYFGEYLILRPVKNHTHPVGEFLIHKNDSRN